MYLYINIYCLYGYYKTIVHEVHFNLRCRYIHLRARKNEIENENAVNLGELFYFTTLAVWIYIFFNSITFFVFFLFLLLYFFPTASEMWEKLEAAAKNNNTEFEILLFWCSHLVFVNTTEKRHSSLLFFVLFCIFFLSIYNRGVREWRLS